MKGNVCDIEFTSVDEGIQKLKKAVNMRDQMSGAMYFQMCGEDCLCLADELSALGVDKNVIASIGGWELRR